jgi:hypothetical protein
MVETFYDCHEPTKETRLQCFLGLDINDLVKQQQATPGSRFVLKLDFSLGEDIEGSMSTACSGTTNTQKEQLAVAGNNVTGRRDDEAAGQNRDSVWVALELEAAHAIEQRHRLGDNVFASSAKLSPWIRPPQGGHAAHLRRR